MRISDWSSDVCSSDLYSYIILILTVYEKHLWSKARAGQRHQTRAGIVVAGVGTARRRGRTMALSKRASEGRAARRAVTRPSACVLALVTDTAAPPPEPPPPADADAAPAALVVPANTRAETLSPAPMEASVENG